MKQNESKRLRKELETLVRSADYSPLQLRSLVAQLMKAESGSVSFSVDASHVARLGRELVVESATAIAELVKNSYDADAEGVRVLFRRAENGRSELIVEDDGVGMTREQVESGFLRIATADKVLNPRSPLKRRLRAGRKGIGRFAMHRLGSEAEVLTCARDGESPVRLLLRWTEFEAGRDIADVPAQLFEGDVPATRGTTITIRDLRDDWTEDKIASLAVALSDIAPVISGRRDRFDVEVFGFDGRLVSADIPRFEDLKRLALASLQAGVDGEGVLEWRVRSSRLELDDSSRGVGADTSKQYPELAGVQVEALYFVYEPSLLPARERNRIKSLAARHGGLRLYRNGFRVQTIGMPGDDWLGLDSLSRRRTVLPPLANANWFGFVKVNDAEGARFEETSSREGLIASDAFHSLTGVVQDVLVAAVLRVASARGRKGRASDQPSGGGAPVVAAAARAEAAVSDIARRVEESGDPSAKQGAKEAVAAVRTLAESARAAGEQNTELLRELALLRVLASMGILVGEVIHEIRPWVSAVEHTLGKLEVGEKSIPDDAVATLRQGIARLRSVLSFVQATYAEQASREVKAHEISDVLGAFVEGVRSDAERNEIDLVCDKSPGAAFTPRMHLGEWASILYNLYTNAKKAIKRSDGTRKILIRSFTSNGDIVVRFEDSGPGIPEAYRERVFEPFFTTQGGPGADDDGSAGFGLGLAIVRDIIEGYGGTIKVVSAGESYSTAIEIKLPQTPHSEVPDSEY